VADSQEAPDEALLRRLREAIGPERAANVDADGHLDAVLRLLQDHPNTSERTNAEPGDV
jgi:hypothetical protein